MHSNYFQHHLTLPIFLNPLLSPIRVLQCGPASLLSCSALSSTPPPMLSASTSFAALSFCRVSFSAALSNFAAPARPVVPGRPTVRVRAASLQSRQSYFCSGQEERTLHLHATHFVPIPTYLIQTNAPFGASNPLILNDHSTITHPAEGYHQS